MQHFKIMALLMWSIVYTTIGDHKKVKLPAHRAGLLMGLGILFYWGQPGAWGSLFKKRGVRSADAALPGAFGCRQTSCEKGPASEFHG
jgi:hypothetical protein